jgi:L-asparagine transporter-like permease
MDGLVNWSVSNCSIPAFIICGIAFLFFLFILPGLCDQDSGIQRRVPYLIFLYIISTLVFFIQLNSHVEEKMSMAVTLSSIYGSVIIHALSILFCQTKTSNFNSDKKDKHSKGSTMEIVVLILVVIFVILLPLAIDTGSVPVFTVFLPLFGLLCIMYFKVSCGEGVCAVKSPGSNTLNRDDKA